MKKYILMMVVAIVAVTTAQAQTVKMPLGATYAEYNLPVTATNTATATMYFNAAVHQPATQDLQVKLTKGTGSLTKVVITLAGSKFGDTWSTIGSAVNWKLTTADTTITISNATANRFRNYKITYLGTGTGTAIINPQKIKLYLE